MRVARFVQTSLQSSCAAAANIQPYWNNMDLNPWMTSEMHPSMLASGQYNTTSQNNNTWGQPISTSAADQAWGNPYDYGSVNDHHHQFQTSRDASPNEDYFGNVDYSSQDPTHASWDANDQPMFSPYSEVPPQIGGLANSTNMAISPMHHPQHPYSSAQIPQSTTASLSASPPNPTAVSSSTKSSKSSKSKSSPKTSNATTSSKSKSTTSSSNKRKASSGSGSSSSKQTRELNKMHLPQEVHRIASEHISREAWRICKAEAIEMEQRRVQLLQNGSGKLEREMLEQRQHLNMIRQGVMREQGVLEDALRRAERLGSGRA
ncbi:hypothetical protein V8F20_005392 [Naviculisporaceae sp. PSN 640]